MQKALSIFYLLFVLSPQWNSAEYRAREYSPYTTKGNYDNSSYSKYRNESKYATKLRTSLNYPSEQYTRIYKITGEATDPRVRQEKVKNEKYSTMY